jgi:tetratricopeptide (TPR) repeat protein
MRAFRVGSRGFLGSSPLLITIVVLPVASCATMSEPERVYLSQAQDAVFRADYPAAEALFHQALGPDRERGMIDADVSLEVVRLVREGRLPEAAANRFFRGMRRHDRGKGRSARTEYLKAIRLAPDQPLLHLLLGIVEFQLRSPDLGLPSLERALALDSTLAAAWVNRGNVHGSHARYELAVADYTRAIELRPDLGIAYSNRGYEHGRNGNFEDAVADLTRATEVSPRLASAHYYLALAHYERCEWQDALASVERARELGYRIRFVGLQPQVLRGVVAARAQEQAPADCPTALRDPQRLDRSDGLV